MVLLVLQARILFFSFICIVVAYLYDVGFYLTSFANYPFFDNLLMLICPLSVAAFQLFSFLSS